VVASVKRSLFQDAIGPLADGIREDPPLRPLFIGGHLLE
jgi:hypothetical protein